MKPLIKVNYGLASSYDEGIEINEKLDAYPKLRDKIIKHERSHDFGKYSRKDLNTDFKSKNSYFFESLNFCSKHPETFINFFPFMYSYHFKALTINLSMFIPQIVLGLINSTFWYFTIKIPFLLSFFVFLLAFSFLNVFFLIYTHNYVKKQQKQAESAQI